MKPMRLTSIDLSKNRYRDYYIHEFEDLFGKYVLEMMWGRIGRKGQTLTKNFDSADERSRYKERVLKVRKRHHYLESGEPF